MLDYHVHLWPHAEVAEPAELRVERLQRYLDQAASEGVHEIALTEHLFRFTAARQIADRFWECDPSAELGAQMAAYFDHHATFDIDRYVTAVLEAKMAGLPVVLGLEVDYYPGKMEQVRRLLDGYPFDVLLGSVHWLGAWGFDVLEGAALGEWDARSLDGVWVSYTDALCELAATRTCDVLAHPDLIKLVGRIPDAGLVTECHARMADAAAAAMMTAEISSAGWRQPVGEAYPAPDLLRRFFIAGVPVTFASDTHGPTGAARRASDLAVLARDAGYGSLRAFRARRGVDVPIAPS